MPEGPPVSTKNSFEALGEENMDVITPKIKTKSAKKSFKKDGVIDASGNPADISQKSKTVDKTKSKDGVSDATGSTCVSGQTGGKGKSGEPLQFIVNFDHSQGGSTSSGILTKDRQNFHKIMTEALGVDTNAEGCLFTAIKGANNIVLGKIPAGKRADEISALLDQGKGKWSTAGLGINVSIKKKSRNSWAIANVPSKDCERLGDFGK